MKNLVALLDAANSDINNVIKCTVFLTDMGDFGAFNKIYEEYFKDSKPARSCVGVK